MNDYTTKAKATFQMKQGKMFKHEIVFDILRRTLPKFELVLATTDARVVRALFMYDDEMENAGDPDDEDAAPAAVGLVATTLFPTPPPGVTHNVSGELADVAGRGDDNNEAPEDDPGDRLVAHVHGPTSIRKRLLTARPTIGKKKAKYLAQ